MSTSPRCEDQPRAASLGRICALLLLVVLSAELATATDYNTLLKHVIVVIMENRTPDNLFFADEVLFSNGGNVRPPNSPSSGPCDPNTIPGQQLFQIPMTPFRLDACFDTRHRHQDWLAMYHEPDEGGPGRMDGACNIALNVEHCPDPPGSHIPPCPASIQDMPYCPAFTYVPNTDGILNPVFKLSRQPDGRWEETVIHNFERGASGNQPVAGVVLDRAGNLYGATLYGGTECDCGVVYKLVPNPDGTWTYTVLHRFTGFDGADPDANLILDDQGNLYGTTATGGPGGGGVVFKVTP